MAISSLKRKRTVAILFGISLVAALFFYKRSVYETFNGLRTSETRKEQISRFDWAKAFTANPTTAPMPTKIYKVMEFSEDADDEEKHQDEVETDDKSEEQNHKTVVVGDTSGNGIKKAEPRSEGFIVEKILGMSRENFESSQESKTDKNVLDSKRKNLPLNSTEITSTPRIKKSDVRIPTSEMPLLTNIERNREVTNTAVNSSRGSLPDLNSIAVTLKPETMKPDVRFSANRVHRTTRYIQANNSSVNATWISKTAGMNNPRFAKLSTSPLSRSTPSPTEEPLACKIPLVDANHPDVSKLQTDFGTNLRKICLRMYPFTPAFKVVNNKLVLKKDVKEKSIDKSSIKLREIRRRGDSDFNYVTLKNPFQGLTSLQESENLGEYDFFRLDYTMNGRKMSDLYARAFPRHDVLERQMTLAKEFENKGLPLNVLILGFDSTSHANFVRKLPRVQDFLRTQLNTYYMQGMSIVGDATTPILIAMLTGKDETALPEGRTSFGGNSIDNWPWIMKDYEDQGYMTLFAEDDPSVGAFNLRLEGFSRSPTHHYMRPFWLSLEDEQERDEQGRCTKSESMVNRTLKYIDDFFDSYPASRKFAFGFHSYLAHARPNYLSYAEEDILWFLRALMDKGYLKDTMLVIMGDHGSRNSEYRDTIQGKLEERLPWFSISLPSQFHRKYPDLIANLRHNQNVITSSFDVHATLRHILTYPNVPSEEQTQSLFEKLPRSRSCKEAGIAEHWCPCFQWTPANVDSKRVQSIAMSAVKAINEKLSKVPALTHACHKLSLGQVFHAVTLHTNTKVQRFSFTHQDGDRSVWFGKKTPDLLRYQIIFTTQPNNAKYEVTASISDSKIRLNPEISRLNRYNNQPACIARQYPYARKFCYCRTSV